MGKLDPNPWSRTYPYGGFLSKLIFDLTPLKTAIFEKSKMTVLWKYYVCGFIFEISDYPKKFLILSYTPYKYEVRRTKTHEMRAKFLRSFLLSPHGRFENFTSFVLMVKHLRFMVQKTSILSKDFNEDIFGWKFLQFTHKWKLWYSTSCEFHENRKQLKI